jgi:hypothetical protein
MMSVPLVSSLEGGAAMKGLGIALLVVGLAGFVWASSQRKGYDSVEGALKSTFSSSERSKKEGWETGRWVGAGLAAVGLVLVLMPARKA